MRFEKKFERLVALVNKRRLRDKRIQDALSKYNRRSLVFKVRNDATYVFHISREDGIRYEVNPAKEPKSMYVEMDLDKAKKLVYRQTLGITDLPSIIHKNIKLADIQFVRKLFGAK